MLDESPIWKQYKDQKMDLFLADKPRFAIEASPGQTNLYLTQVKDIYKIFVVHIFPSLNLVNKFQEPLAQASIYKSCSIFSFLN